MADVSYYQDCFVMWLMFLIVKIQDCFVIWLCFLWLANVSYFKSQEIALLYG